MGRTYYKLVYYREKPNIIDTRNFRSVDEFNDWYKRQMEIEPVRILNFYDVFVPAYEGVTVYEIDQRLSQINEESD